MEKNQTAEYMRNNPPPSPENSYRGPSMQAPAAVRQFLSIMLDAVGARNRRAQLLSGGLSAPGQINGLTVEFDDRDGNHYRMALELDQR